MGHQPPALGAIAPPPPPPREPPPTAHLGVCCPGTNITVEVSQRIQQSLPGGGGLPGGGSSSGGSSGGLPSLPKLPGGDTPSTIPSSGALPNPSQGVDAPAGVAEVESDPVKIMQGGGPGTKAGEGTAMAQCPRMPLPDEPGYTTICRHDNTSNLQVCFFLNDGVA
jgi:hypothetical protein